MGWIWRLALTWMTGGPLAVLRSPALLVISPAHARVGGSLALPTVGVPHVCPGVPHIGLRPLSGAPRHC